MHRQQSCTTLPGHNQQVFPSPLTSAISDTSLVPQTQQPLSFRLYFRVPDYSPQNPPSGGGSEVRGLAQNKGD